MNNNFNVNVFSDDANFSSSLALECNKYGFELTFFEMENFEKVLNSDKSLVSINIIDLSGNNLENKYILGKQVRKCSNSPVFGVVDIVNSENRNKSKINGFDLIFTKKVLLKSIKKVIIHISDK